MYDFLNKIWTWVSAFFGAIKDLLYDIALKIYGELLDVLISLLYSFGINPTSLSEPFQNALDGLSPAVLYFMSLSGFNDCLVVLSSAMAIWTAFKIIAFIRG